MSAISDEPWDFFVSHSSRDREIVEQLVSELEAAPFALRCCVSYREFNRPRANRRHGEWNGMIDEGIAQSAQLLLVLTEHALASTNVRDEIIVARQRNRTLRAVVVDENADALRQAIRGQTLFAHVGQAQWLRYPRDRSQSVRRQETAAALAEAPLAGTAGGSDAGSDRVARLTLRQRKLAEEYEAGRVEDSIRFPTPGYTLDLIYVPRPEDGPSWWRGQGHGFYVSAHPISAAQIRAMHVRADLPRPVGDSVPRSVAQAVAGFAAQAHGSRLRLLTPEELTWALRPEPARPACRNPFGIGSAAGHAPAWCWSNLGIVAVDPQAGAIAADVELAEIWLRC